MLNNTSIGAATSYHGTTPAPGHDAPAGSQPVNPYKIDVSQGQMRGDVSAQWCSRPADQRFDNLEDLYRFKLDHFDRCRDLLMPTTKFELGSPALLEGDCGLTPETMRAENLRRAQALHALVDVSAGGDVQSIIETSPTHWAFGQMASLADFSARELRKLPTPYVADILNYQLKYNTNREDVKLFLNPEELLSAQSPTYGRVPDHQLVEAAMMIAGRGLGDDPRFHWKTPGKIDWSNGTYDPENIGPSDDHTFYGSDRDCFIFLVDDRRPIIVGKTRDGNDDVMFRGFYLQNSQVGARSLKLACFYLRGVCMNRNLWGVEKFNEITIRHTSGAPSRWLAEAKPALESFAAHSDATLIEGVNRAKVKELADSDDAALAFLRKRNFSKLEASKIAETADKEEGRPLRTVWDFGQAITAYARDLPNSDTRLDTELKAKTIFDMVA